MAGLHAANPEVVDQPLGAAPVSHQPPVMACHPLAILPPEDEGD